MNEIIWFLAKALELEIRTNFPAKTPQLTKHLNKELLEYSFSRLNESSCRIGEVWT